MKMKLTLVAVAILTAILVRLFTSIGLLLVIGVPAVFAVYGIARSLSVKLDPLNDVPNAFRVFLASLSALLIVIMPDFQKISAAVALFATSILLNDEYQRRTLDSMRNGRRGGSVAILGIDGSGKSTHTAELESWFVRRGYYCTRMPFHRYLFVDRLTRARKTATRTSGERRGGNPLRPFLSAIDNLLLYLISSFGRGVEGRVVLYDRYIWSTFVKYEGLGYPVRPVRWLYLLPRPRCAVVLDIPVEKSLGVIESRPDHIRYAGAVLSKERSAYLAIARTRGCSVVDATPDFGTVQDKLEGILGQVFPAVGGSKTP